MISELEYKKIESYFLEYGYTECKNFNLRQNLNTSLINKSEYDKIDNLINNFLYNKGIKKLYNRNQIKLNIADTIILREKILNTLLEREIQFGLRQFVNMNSGFTIKNNQFISNSDCIYTYNIYNPIIYAYLLQSEVDIEKNEKQISIPYNINNDDISKILLENNFNKEGRTVFSLFNIASLYGKQRLIKIVEELYENCPKGSTIVFDYYTNETKEKSLLEDIILYDNPKNRFDFMEMEEILGEIGFLVYEHLDNIELKNRFYDIGELDKEVPKNYKIILATKYN